MRHNNITKLNIIIGVAAVLITLLTGCAERVEIKREWPMPLKLDTGIIQKCNSIHNTRCSKNIGEMTNAIYYFDKRKLKDIEKELKKTNPDIKGTPLYDIQLLHKKVKYANAYKATFLRKSCSVEYYIMGENVTCEKFIDYITRLKEDCRDCIEVIKIEANSVSTY